MIWEITAQYVSPRKSLQPDKIFDARRSHLQQISPAHQDRQALRTTNSHVEPIRAEQKLRSARRIGTIGDGHGDDGDWCFLSLETIHGADPRAIRQMALQDIHLSVEGRNNQDVFQSQSAVGSVLFPELLG
jgi:hypothetical protein